MHINYIAETLVPKIDAHVWTIKFNVWVKDCKFVGTMCVWHNLTGLVFMEFSFMYGMVRELAYFMKNYGGPSMFVVKVN